MRCAIDMSGITVGAGITYARNLLPALAAAAPGSTFFVLLPGAGEALGLALPENFHLIAVPRAASSPVRRVAMLQVWLPLWTQRHGVDVLYSAFDYSAPLVTCPLVLGIHNLSPYAGPRASSYYGRRREQAIRVLARLSARRARAVLFVSEAAREIIHVHLAVDPARCHVVHYGLGEEFFRNGDAPEGGGRQAEHLSVGGARAPYILSVGSVAVHKDLDSLLLAFARLIREEASPYHLVIAGPVIDPRYHDRLRRIAAEHIPEGRVSFVGPVPHGQMPALYRGAAAAVLASRAETFGMPLAEAMASGVPTIASDIPALREIGRDAVLYYPPGDPDRLAGFMADALRKPALRERLSQAGRDRARAFSWRRAAAETYRLIEAVGRGS